MINLVKTLYDYNALAEGRCNFNTTVDSWFEPYGRTQIANEQILKQMESKKYHAYLYTASMYGVASDKRLRSKTR